MKSKWIFLIPVIVGFIACTDDEPDKNHSIITVETGEQNEFDGWLLNNYIYPSSSNTGWKILNRIWTIHWFPQK